MGTIIQTWTMTVTKILLSVLRKFCKFAHKEICLVQLSGIGAETQIGRFTRQDFKNACLKQ